MQLVTLYNATTKTQYFSGITALEEGAARDLALPQVDFDAYYRPLLERGPATGLGAYAPDASFALAQTFGLFNVLQERHTSTGSMSAAARMQICVTASGAYDVTLPAASDLDAGEIIYVFNDARDGDNTLTVVPDGTDTVAGNATLTSGVVVFAALSGVPASVTVALVEDATTASGIHSIVEVAGVSTIINAEFSSGDVTAADVVAAIMAGTGVTVAFTGSVNVSATTASGATVVAAAGAAALVPTPVALTAAANTLRFVSDGVSNWTTY